MQKFNDVFGHLSGDKILIEIARIIKDVTGDNGYVYKYGGEEIMAVLPLYNKDDAVNIAERIRKKIESLEDYNSKVRIKPTISTKLSALW